MIPPAAWAMAEDDGPDSLDAHVRRLTMGLGLWGYHARTSIGSEPGWPDWVILGPAGALFRELKTEHGQLTVPQRRVGSKLTRAGLDWGVWRPRDLFDDTIANQLGRIS